MPDTLPNMSLYTAHDGATIIRTSTYNKNHRLYKDDTLYLYHDTTDTNNNQGWVVSYEPPVQIARYDVSIAEHDGYGAYATSEHRLVTGRVDECNPRRITTDNPTTWYTETQRVSIYCPTLTNHDTHTVYVIRLTHIQLQSHITNNNVYVPGFGILTEANTGYDRYDRHRPTLGTIEDHPRIQQCDTILSATALLSFIGFTVLTITTLAAFSLIWLLSLDKTTSVMGKILQLSIYGSMFTLLSSVGSFGLYVVIIMIPYIYQRRRWNRTLAQLPPLTSANDSTIDDDTYNDVSTLCALVCAHDNVAHTDTATSVYDTIDDIIVSRRHTDIINALADPNHSDHNHIDAAAITAWSDAYTERTRRYDSHQALDQLIFQLDPEQPMAK